MIAAFCEASTEGTVAAALVEAGRFAEAAAAFASFALECAGSPSCGGDVVFSRTTRPDALFQGLPSAVTCTLEVGTVADVDGDELEIIASDADGDEEEILLPATHVWAAVLPLCTARRRGAWADGSGGGGDGAASAAPAAMSPQLAAALSAASTFQRIVATPETSQSAAQSSWFATLAIALAKVSEPTGWRVCVW